MRTLIKAVSRIVTAQASHCCRCRFEKEDKYGKYLSGDYHDNWEVWHQVHTNPNFEYFLKCVDCKYELAKQYWDDVDYADGLIILFSVGCVVNTITGDTFPLSDDNTGFDHSEKMNIVDMDNDRFSSEEWFKALGKSELIIIDDLLAVLGRSL